MRLGTMGLGHRLLDHLLPFDALLPRLKAQDPQAWAEFYRRYEPFLLRVVRRRLGPSLRRQVDSQDVVQSVFRAALTGLPGDVLENEHRLLGWLAAVARYRVSRVGRRANAPGGAMLVPLDEASETAGSERTPLESAEQAEALHRLKAALDRLPPDEQEAVLLRDFEGASFAEVARRLGRPSADAARKLHDRARARLASSIADPPPRSAAPGPGA